MTYKKQAELKARENKIQENPFCLFCGQPATDAHHFIEKGVSNFLRTDSRNLISVCFSHHDQFHRNTAEMKKLTIEKLGEEWYQDIMADSVKFIKDTEDYWKSVLETLSDAL